MTAEEIAFDLIARWETYRASSYQDVAGIWTVGYGSIGPTVGPRTVWEKDRATDELKKRIAKDSHIIQAMLDVPANVNQKAAFLSLAYNIGLQGFEHSSVLRHHNASEFQAAADSFLMWDKAHVDGKLVVVNGLHNRRVSERALYLKAP